MRCSLDIPVCMYDAIRVPCHESGKAQIRQQDSALTLVNTRPPPPHITNGHNVRHAQAVRNSRNVAMPQPESSSPSLLSLASTCVGRRCGKTKAGIGESKRRKGKGEGGKEAFGRFSTVGHLQGCVEVDGKRYIAVGDSFYRRRHRNSLAWILGLAKEAHRGSSRASWVFAC